MKQFHITVFYVHLAGSSQVSADESNLVFVRAYGVGAVLVDCNWAELRFDPFGELHLRKLSGEELNRHPSFREPYQELWDSLTADDWMESTTNDCIVLPVSTIHFRESREGTFADLQDYLRTPVAVG